MLRSLFMAVVFLLGGLHGGPLLAAQCLGHEDDCLEYRREGSKALPHRESAPEAAPAHSRPYADAGGFALLRPAMVEPGQARASLLGLGCQFLI